MESDEIRVMRGMAWERAKGELKSIEYTYYHTKGNNDERYERFSEKLHNFIKDIEENSLQE
ncbi:MAG: hypothetical protein GY714_10675 [Desulfobacterales bacterium]|nr:hypothetical protein [Desulfobacterales bacterium]